MQLYAIQVEAFSILLTLAVMTDKFESNRRECSLAKPCNLCASIETVTRMSRAYLHTCRCIIVHRSRFYSQSISLAAIPVSAHTALVCECIRTLTSPMFRRVASYVHRHTADAMKFRKLLRFPLDLTRGDAPRFPHSNFYARETVSAVQTSNKTEKFPCVDLALKQSVETFTVEMPRRRVL